MPARNRVQNEACFLHCLEPQGHFMCIERRQPASRPNALELSNSLAFAKAKFCLCLSYFAIEAASQLGRSTLGFIICVSGGETTFVVRGMMQSDAILLCAVYGKPPRKTYAQKASSMSLATTSPSLLCLQTCNTASKHKLSNGLQHAILQCWSRWAPFDADGVLLPHSVLRVHLGVTDFKDGFLNALSVPLIAFSMLEKPNLQKNWFQRTFGANCSADFPRLAQLVWHLKV